MMKSYQNLSKESIEIGHFKSQGKHYSGLSYTALLKLWEVGGPNGTGFIKSSRKQFLFNIDKYLERNELDKILSDWNMKTHRKTDSLNKFLNAYARFLRDQYKDTFGVSKLPHMPTATPLYETGELQSKTAYKTSRGRRVTTT